MARSILTTPGEEIMPSEKTHDLTLRNIHAHMGLGNMSIFMIHPQPHSQDSRTDSRTTGSKIAETQRLNSQSHLCMRVVCLLMKPKAFQGGPGQQRRQDTEVVEHTIAMLGPSGARLVSVFVCTSSNSLRIAV